MTLNKEMENEILNIIETPTVLVCNDRPIEYKGTVNIRKIKKRKVEKVSAALFNYIIDNGGSIDSLERFSSGDFFRFLSLSNIYQ